MAHVVDTSGQHLSLPFQRTAASQTLCMLTAQTAPSRSQQHMLSFRSVPTMSLNLLCALQEILRGHSVPWHSREYIFSSVVSRGANLLAATMQQ